MSKHEVCAFVGLFLVVLALFGYDQENPTWGIVVLGMAGVAIYLVGEVLRRSA